MPVKSSLILICSFILFSGLKAQSIDYGLVTSSETKLKMGQYFDEVIFENKDFIYTVTRREITGFLEEKNIDVEVYDRTLKRVRKKSFSLEYKGNLLQYESLKYINGELYLFTSFFNSAQKRNFLFMEVFDASTLKKTKKIEIVGAFDSANRYESGFIGFEQSFDKSKFLVYCQLSSKRKDNEKVYCIVFDSGMNVLWEKTLELPYEDKKINVFAYQVSNNGEVFFLCRYFTSEGKRTGNYLLASFNYGGTGLHEYKLSLTDKIISDLKFIVNNNNDLLVAGLYSITSWDKAKGVVYFRIDPRAKKIEMFNTQELDPELIVDVVDFSFGKKRDRVLSSPDKLARLEIGNFVIRDLIPRSDGGLLMLTEKYYVREYNSMNTGFYTGRPTGVGTVNYSYHYEEIIVYNISPRGEIEWSTLIPKIQYSFNDRGYYLGFNHAVTSKGISILFNDFGSSGRGGQMDYNFRNNVSTNPIIWRIGQNGTTENQILGQLGKRLKIIPKNTAQVSGSSIFIYQGGRGIQQFSILKL
jgi:hypothetical protein